MRSFARLPPKQQVAVTCQRGQLASRVLARVCKEEGRWTQGDHALLVTLLRAGSSVAGRRRQPPKPSFSHLALLNAEPQLLNAQLDHALWVPLLWRLRPLLEELSTHARSQFMVLNCTRRGCTRLGCKQAGQAAVHVCQPLHRAGEGWAKAGLAPLGGFVQEGANKGLIAPAWACCAGRRSPPPPARLPQDGTCPCLPTCFVWTPAMAETVHVDQ